MSRMRDTRLDQVEKGIFESHEHIDLKANILYYFLPAIMQSRMPTLPSFRRSVHDSSPGTPPPGYTSTPTSGSTTPECYRSVAATSVFNDNDENGAPITTPGRAVFPQSGSPYECSTGINWQHARHGVVGLKEAHHVAYTTTHDNDVVVTAILRSQYLHSMTLLLRSLPPELTPGEQLTLAAALPQSLNGANTPGKSVITRPHADAVTREQAPAQTLLWQVTSCLVFRVLLLVQFLLPYLRISFRYATRLDHDHQLLRRAFHTGCAIGGGVGRKLGQTACRLHNGVVGEALCDAAVYFVENIVGGIQQGLTEASKLRQMRGHGRTADIVIR